ncbi:homeobox domain-containing protein [Purpureocillium lilacinum]|uniref:Homeobox domain-containing protein n=1 Tax=Purpureocillium lilacinum TaxID=33203 RepID=A0A179FF58_PURLI|nr:homeobox domain-containing protein [Purpureocillium lilacinum]
MVDSREAGGVAAGEEGKNKAVLGSSNTDGFAIKAPGRHPWYGAKGPSAPIGVANLPASRSYRTYLGRQWSGTELVIWESAVPTTRWRPRVLLLPGVEIHFSRDYICVAFIPASARRLLAVNCATRSGIFSYIPVSSSRTNAPPTVEFSIMPDTYHTSLSPFRFYSSSDPQHTAAASSNFGIFATQEMSLPGPYQPDASPVHWHPSQSRQSRGFRQSGTRKWKGRFSKDDVEILEMQFQRNKMPCKRTKMALAESIQADVTRVNNWFQNRRAREKSLRNTQHDGVTHCSEIKRLYARATGVQRFSGASSAPRASSNCENNATSIASPSCSVKFCDIPNSSPFSPLSESRWSSDTNVSDDLSNSRFEYENCGTHWSFSQDSDALGTMPHFGCSLYSQAAENFLAVASVAGADDWSANL